jgi:nucleotide-binding universal stress UspA family protein
LTGINDKASILPDPVSVRKDQPMKSIMLHVGSDIGFDSRCQVALDIARQCGGHVTLVQPGLAQDFVAYDMAGGAHFVAQAFEAAEEARAKDKERIEADLNNEDVSWDWQIIDGTSKSAILGEAARLSDLAITSFDPDRKGAGQAARSLIGDLTITGRTPVLAVPAGHHGLKFGTALIAYDGGPEASFALRCAVPLLAHFEHVKIVEIGSDDGEFPMTDAAEYLARHGIEARIEAVTKAGKPVEERLMSAVQAMNADLLVMGAYGHSRWREALFGGVTHYVMAEIGVPVLLAH